MLKSKETNCVTPSGYRVRKIIGGFCLDIEASKVALLLRASRSTVNRWHGLLRKAIHPH